MAESEEDIARYADLCERLLAKEGPSFFPPVTEEQIQAAEARMGYRLPTLLRMLYMHVGNGGFGPGVSGIFGIAGGCFNGWWWNGIGDQKYHPFIEEDYTELISSDDPRLQETIESTVSHTGWRWEPDVERRLIEDNNSYIMLLEKWPTDMATLCDMGCGGAYHLDLRSGHIYDAGCWSCEDAEDERTKELPMETPYACGVSHVFSSIEELIQYELQPPQSSPIASGSGETRCLGLYGPYGFTRVIPHLGPTKDDMRFEDDNPRTDVDVFLDSEDYRDYQAWQNAETENNG